MTPSASPRSNIDFRRSFAFFEKHRHSILFLAILVLGVFARTWEFASLPPGLHQDEASIGVDAFYIYKYGIDRNGFSYPVHLAAWGSGQNAMYAYLLIPFLAALGLKAWVIRIPILISGILTLPLVYWIAKRVVDRRFGLLAMFCIAISPWHILLSRWGLESNLLPFFFSLGFLFLLKTGDDWRWFLAANLCFGLCLYTYGTAYAAIPIFLGFATLVLLRACATRTLSLRQLAAGFLVLGVVGAPIILFVLINLLKLDTLHLGPVSVPRLPVVSRFEGLGAMFQGDSTSAVQNYAAAFLNVMFFQDDFRSRNGFPPYGYFYGVTFLPALVGAGLFITNLKKSRAPTLLFLSWLLTAFILGVLQPVNINRINLIFIPLIASVAYLAYWLGQRYRFVLPTTLLAMLVAFGLFTRDYHGPAYHEEIGREFYEGLVPAIEFARGVGSGPVCVTNTKIYMPYIFVLFNEPVPPAQFIQQVEYVDPTEPLREVRALGRYTFGLENCQAAAETSFILFENEKFPFKGDYRKKAFGNYIVYSPR